MAQPGVANLIGKAKAIYPKFNHDNFHDICSRVCIDMDAKGKDKNTGYGFLFPKTFLEEVEKLAKGIPADDPTEECKSKKRITFIDFWNWITFR